MSQLGGTLPSSWPRCAYPVLSTDARLRTNLITLARVRDDLETHRGADSPTAQRGSLQHPAVARDECILPKPLREFTGGEESSTAV